MPLFVVRSSPFRFLFHKNGKTKRRPFLTGRCRADAKVYTATCKKCQIIGESIGFVKMYASGSKVTREYAENDSGMVGFDDNFGKNPELLELRPEKTSRNMEPLSLPHADLFRTDLLRFVFRCILNTPLRQNGMVPHAA